jgi:Asp/Glu/hydantoin racemase
MPGLRIGLIHALPDSVAPAQRAFAELWPEADIFGVLDDALARDLAAAGGKTTMEINSRIIDLGRYVLSAGAKGILYSCSAFGQSIKAAGMMLPIPVLRPNEAAIDAALDAGPRIAVLSTFQTTADAIKTEIESAAKARNLTPTVDSRLVPGALEALQGGKPEEHDRLIAKAAAELPACDVVMLSQFSMARAASAIAPVDKRPVLTTPGSAVKKLRAVLKA